MDSGLTEPHSNMNSQSKRTDTQGSQQCPPKSEETARYRVRPTMPRCWDRHGEYVTEHMTVMQPKGKLERVP